MNEKFERFVNTLIVNFDNFYKSKTGAWFLDGSTLIEFVCNRRLKEPINIGMVNCSKETFKERMYHWEVKETGEDTLKAVLLGYTVNVKFYKNLNTIIAPKDRIEENLKKRDTAMNQYGVWRYNLDQSHWYHFPVPYKVGGFLDDTYPLWFMNIKHEDISGISNDIFFDDKRSENAVELMKLIRECAEAAGFGNYVFPAFGTLLGIIREGGFIGSDRDLDHGIAGWKITAQQEENFIREVMKERIVIEKAPDGREVPVKYPQGLATGRFKHPQKRSDNGRFLWTSIGHKKIKSQQGTKSCVWKFFKHKDFAWHSKGRKWLADRKFPGVLSSHSGNAQAIAKGMPLDIIDEFVKMEFRGVKINVPQKAGHCLDMWYPYGWPRPRKDKSSKEYTMIITRWEDEKKWKMV